MKGGTRRRKVRTWSLGSRGKPSVRRAGATRYAG